jgi:hypothetical protein
MGFLRDWWQRLRGDRDDPPHAAGRWTRPAEQPARPRKPDAPLELVDAPQARPTGRRGAAGFDPYGNDAGYAKPHGWERVDHD